MIPAPALDELVMAWLRRHGIDLGDVISWELQPWGQSGDAGYQLTLRVFARLVVWDDYRKCHMCGAITGEPCLARSGKIVSGVPDGARVTLPLPHAGRPLRTRRSGR